MDSIPDSFTAVPVTVDDNCHIYKARMVAGSVGIRVTSSGDTLDSRELRGFITGPNREQIPQYMEPQTEPESGWTPCNRYLVGGCTKQLKIRRMT